MLAIFGIGMTELIILAIILGIFVVPVVAIVIVAVVVAGKSRRS